MDGYDFLSIIYFVNLVDIKCTAVAEIILCGKKNVSGEWIVL